MVIHSQHFKWFVSPVKISGAIDDQVNSPAGLLVIQILLHQLAAPAGIDEVIEANPVNVFLFQEVKNLRDILDVPAVNGETKAYFDPRFLAMMDAPQGGIKGSFHPSKAVVGLPHPVQAYSNIGKPDPFQLPGDLFGDQGAIGGNDRAHTPVGGHSNQVQEVLPQQRFPPGKKNDRRSKPGQVFDQRLSFFRGKFPGIFSILRLRVTMNTLQITALADVPDYHRLLIFRKLQEMRRQLGRVALVAQRVRGLHSPAV